MSEGVGRSTFWGRGRGWQPEVLLKEEVGAEGGARGSGRSREGTRDEDGGLGGRLEEGNGGGGGGDGDRGDDRVRQARNRVCGTACATATRERRGAGQPGGDGDGVERLAVEMRGVGKKKRPATAWTKGSYVPVGVTN